MTSDPQPNFNPSELANPSAPCADADTASGAPSPFTGPDASPAAAAFSTDPLPAHVGKCADASESDAANRPGQDHAEVSTKVDPTVSDRGNESHPDLAAVEQFQDELTIASVGGARSLVENEGTPAHPVSLENPNAGRSDSEDYRVKEANRRLQILTTFRALIAQGRTKAQACRQVGVGYSTMWRWIKGFAKTGFNGLLPATDKCGRKSILEKLGLPSALVLSAMDQTQGLNLDAESTTSSLRIFAKSDRCPEGLANVILDPKRCSKHAIPPSIRALAAVSKNARLAHRGPRALALGGIWTPRKLDILPGDIFCSDDTTPIWAWWVPWVECEEYPFGVKLLQGQFLPVIDVASQKCVTFVLIAREKSSYRACDIWSLFGHTFDVAGIPRLGWQLERGSWESLLIAGMEIEYLDGEMTCSRRVGGLRQLPTNVTPWHREKLGSNFAFPQTLQTWTSFLPKTKSIEAFFDRSQGLEGTLYGCLGRDQMRKPFEIAKKKFQECSRIRAKEDPRHHFLSQAEIASRLVGLMDYLNNEPMQGEVFRGVPHQLYEQAVGEHPLLRLGDEMRWLYQRNWKVTPITQGWARCRLADEMTGVQYSLFYGNPEVFARYEGQSVVVYYDRENFEQPAQIILARTGEYLCSAQYVERKGSFLGGDLTGHDMRKRWKNAVMSAYGTIAKHAPSRQLPAEIAARRAEAKGSSVATMPRSNVATAAQVTVAPRVPQRYAPASRSLAPVTDPAALQQQRERLARQAGRANRMREFQADT